MKVAIAISIFFQFFSITMKSALAKELPEEVTVSLLGPDNAPLPPQKTATVKKSDEEWLKQLGPERFRILRTEGTEQPFCGTLLDNKKTGVYLCAGCELPLFSSRAKFHSGTGWPSFFTPFAQGECGRNSGPKPWNDSHRNSLCALRWSLGTRISGRSSADWASLLPEFRGARFSRDKIAQQNLEKSVCAMAFIA